MFSFTILIESLLIFYHHSIFIESWMVKPGNHDFLGGCDVHPPDPVSGSSCRGIFDLQGCLAPVRAPCPTMADLGSTTSQVPGWVLAALRLVGFQEGLHDINMKRSWKRHVFFWKGQHSSYLIVILIATSLQRHQYSDYIQSFSFNQNFPRLKHHLQRFLREKRKTENPLNHNGAVFLRALEAVLRLGSLLTRRGIADVDAIVRRRAAPGLVLSFDIVFGSPNISTQLNTNSTSILFFCYLYSTVRLVVCFFVASKFWFLCLEPPKTQSPIIHLQNSSIIQPYHPWTWGSSNFGCLSECTWAPGVGQGPWRLHRRSLEVVGHPDSWPRPQKNGHVMHQVGFR